MDRIHSLSNNISQPLYLRQHRRWLSLKENNTLPSIRVMTYNLLAPSNTKSNYFKNHSKKDLSKYRRMSLLTRLVKKGDSRTKPRYTMCTRTRCKGSFDLFNKPKYPQL